MKVKCKSKILSFVTALAVFVPVLFITAKSYTCSGMFSSFFKETEKVLPLCAAARDGNLQVVRYMVDHGENVNCKDGKGRTPLHFAAENGHLEVVKFLVEHSAHVECINDKNETPLDLATRNNHAEIVRFLMEKRNSSADCLIM